MDALDFGTFPDWLAGIGGFLAAWAAFIAWRLNKQMLNVEEERDMRALKQLELREEIENRRQASLVFAMVAKSEGEEFKDQWGIFLYNGSTQPIFNIQIVYRSKAFTLNAIPPGQFFIPPDAKYKWGNLIDLKLNPIPIQYIVKGGAGGLISEVTFEDIHQIPRHLKNGLTLV